MHLYSARMVLASSSVFEHGKHLALGAGVVGIVAICVPALASRVGRPPARGSLGYGLDRVRFAVGCISLCLAAAGLVMMAVGSS
jgi:hypothetical protein